MCMVSACGAWSRHVMLRRRALRRRLAALGCEPSDTQLRGLQRCAELPAGAPCVPGSALLRLAVLRAYRWPELSPQAPLRRLPGCEAPDCCNPQHWARVCEPESPPPPYCRIAMEDKIKPKDHQASSEDPRRTDHERMPAGSLPTDGEDRKSWESEWCRLAYWELTRRVGRQYGVRPPAVDVFGSWGGAGRQGLCLDALTDPPPGAPQPLKPPPDQVKKTRAKIGLGVTLSLESDGVWLYNRSEEPVFVSSPALDAAAARATLVWRVAPGHCLCIFNHDAPPPPTPKSLGPVDPRSVRISFAKGWGPKYSRRDVTACPCWLEVLLAPAS